MILITCAVGKELGDFQPPPHVEMLVTGVGPVEAAVAVSRALAQSHYDLVISAGIAGAFDGMAEVGEGVVVTDEIFELDLETGTAISLPEAARVIDRAGSDLTLVDRLVELGFRSLRGITVPRVTATDRTAARLSKHGVGVESMEGFAVLRAAEIAAVPAIEVRGISNIVCERSASRWDFSAGVRGAEKVLNALLKVIGNIDA
ncbi:MAG TPA: futalosine hydrolase [Candidatus Baltobacteraceae bacterium]|jgi:futalosine hydrolase|nr:futalosine hydrolase [Candidatus Baltobacteraceae bacterium]